MRPLRARVAIRAIRRLFGGHYAEGITGHYKGSRKEFLEAPHVRGAEFFDAVKEPGKAFLQSQRAGPLFLDRRPGKSLFPCKLRRILANIT